MRKILTSLALAGSLALFGSGCSGNHPEFEFKGKIGEERVEFINGGVYADLRVEKTNGTRAEYCLINGERLLLLGITIFNGDRKIIYNFNNIGVDFMNIAQSNVNAYLTNIVDIKRVKALGDIGVK